MTEGSKEDFMRTAFNVDDFQGLGRRKIWRLINLFLSEFFATAVFVYLGCATVQGNLFNQSQNHLTVAIAFSFAVGTSVMLFGHISGSHINPCLSLTAVILGDMSFALALFYSVAQCLGATFGYSLTRGILPSESNVNPVSDTYNKSVYSDRCCTVPDLRLTVLQVLLAEICGTGVLIWAVCAAWDKRNKDKHDSLAVKFAMVILAIALPTALYSGCSLNPARSFGPALYNGLWEHHWLYWIGPLTGTLITATIYRVIFDPSHMEITPESRRDPSTLNLRHNSHKDDDA